MESKCQLPYEAPAVEVTRFAPDGGVFTQDIWESGEHWTGYYSLGMEEGLD